MTMHSFTQNIYEVANGYRNKGYRYVSGEWTWDGTDRTFQSSGAGNTKPSTLDHAERVARRLREAVVESGLPFQWLLDATIEVEVYDMEECEYVRDSFAIVYVNNHFTIEGQGTFTNNGRAFGIQVVRTGSGGGFDPMVDKAMRKHGCLCDTANTGRIEHKFDCQAQERMAAASDQHV